ncbi:MAG: hypothetical protein SGILL_008372 [Bacillariaceae sp.]
MTPAPPKIKRIPTQVFIGAYQGEDKASELERLITQDEQGLDDIICTNMAVARRDIAGKTQIRELGNPQILEEAVESAMLGGLLGSMSRLMIGNDAIVGRAAQQIKKEQSNCKPGARRSSALIKAATKQVAPGFSKDKLQTLGKALKPNSSAIVLIFDEVLVKQSDYDEKMSSDKAERDAISEMVVSKIDEHLSKGNDIAFHITFGEDGEISATRTVQGQDALQVRDIVLSQEKFSMDQITTTEDGKLATDQLVVTPEAVATARTLLTSSLVAYEVSLEDEDGFVYDKGAMHETSTPGKYEMTAARESGAVTANSIEETTEVKVIKGNGEE